MNPQSQYVYNMAIGFGLITASAILTIAYVSLLKLMGVVKSKPVVVPPQLTKEDKVNGIKEWSQQIVLPATGNIVYSDCSEEFKCFFWFLLWAVPILITFLMAFGVGNLVIYFKW